MSESPTTTPPPAPEVSFPDAAALHQGAAAVAAALAEAATLADSGTPVALDGLEQRVDALCRAALALPAAEARPLAAGLQALLDALDGLSAALDRQHRALTGGDPHSDRRRAAAAYGRGTGGTP